MVYSPHHQDDPPHPYEDLENCPICLKDKIERWADCAEASRHRFTIAEELLDLALRRLNITRPVEHHSHPSDMYMLTGIFIPTCKKCQEYIKEKLSES